MSTSTKAVSRSAVFNLPNQLTIARLVLSFVLFGLISAAQSFSAPSLSPWRGHLYMASLVVFVVAASTDWLDGYFARKYGMVTMLGRILDPFVDKIIICGTFICLVADANSGVNAWMAVVVVGRELLITALRSFLEQQGADFSASMSGKLKMVFQCVAAGVSLFCLTYPSDQLPGKLHYLLIGSVWAALILTVYSGFEYVRRAIGLLRG
ncbi:MAG TPA: CDP-diacylglycerol--glycerol-3-phosphate 3-phosphatidyltransferase [Pirellulales bacterium]|nr:CDP-diacylglycerol--glycerol-3-phosphate 3-phosphatidyltransferase [Pirellulales bacterium]